VPATGPRPKPTKFVFVTGGVVSSIGKGLTAACIGALMEARGLRVTNIKLDPYINVDPGTMNPFQHGEVFVTDDGAETDLDLGHYERFTSATMRRANNFTTGQVYDSVIQKERRGEYLGGTVQVIPHITDEIQAKIRAAAQGVDLAIVEIGGTVGDIESLPFLEAIRQMRLELGEKNALNIHVTLVPHIKTAGELKTKPTQHSVKELREIGISPDIIVCRSEKPLQVDIKKKISLFCNVPVDGVISAYDVKNIYDMPVVMHEEGLDQRIVDVLGIWSREPDLAPWTRIRAVLNETTDEVRIGIVGKYVGLQESYKSLNEALSHGGIANEVRVKLVFIDAEEVDKQGADATVTGVDAVLVPGGFGRRGIEGKIAAVRFARERKLPYLGICLGMQIACIEFARDVCGLGGADSTEFRADTPHPVIDLLPEQRHIKDKGATMRLGAYPCKLTKGTLAEQVYGATDVRERHRHRYEVNNDYRARLEAGGMRLSGQAPDGSLVEMVELPDHPWFLACQFHPEYRSRPMAAHPIFASFVAAAKAMRGTPEAQTPAQALGQTTP